LQRLIDYSPRDLKAELLGDFEVDNYFPDVWLLTERDEASTLEGQPGDLFVIRLTEKSGAGYLWTTGNLVDAGFAILRDTRRIPAPENAIGGPVTRDLTARHIEPASGEFAMELKRPWQEMAPPIAKLHVTYELLGKEIGMPRAIRRQLRVA
jgi:predicted secreted protein